MIVVLIVVLIIIFVCIKNSNQPNSPTPNNIEKPKIHNNNQKKKTTNIKEKKFEDMSISLDSITPNELIYLEKEIFDLFLKYEDAYSNFDYDKLSEICTDNHFKEIHKVLERMISGNKKRSFENITLNNFKLMSITNTSNLQKLSVFLEVSLIDYILDKEYNFLVKGNKNIKITKNIKMEIVQKIDTSDLRDHCPKCGAPINLIFPACKFCSTAIYKDAEYKINYFDA